MKLYHCLDARSLRCMWLLKELKVPYDLITLKFPPRLYHKDYKSINPLSTIPYFVDNDVKLTESVAVLEYLVEKYSPTKLKVDYGEKDFGVYKNFLHQSDATLTYPQTLTLRYTVFEPKKEYAQLALDYSKVFIGRLKLLEAHLNTNNREFICSDRFTIADIAVTYALYLGHTKRFNLKHDLQYGKSTLDYMNRMISKKEFVECLKEQEDSIKVTEKSDFKLT